MPYDLATLAEGIKRASAKGDTASVQKLGAAYRQLQSSQAQAPASQDNPPAGAVPGSREYADWAVQQAKAGKPLPPILGSQIPTNAQKYGEALEGVRRIDFPQFSEADFKKRTAERGVLQPLNPGEIVQNDQLFGGADELAGGANALADMLKGGDPAKAFAAYKDLQQARRDLGVEQNGMLGQGASILGSLTSFGGGANTVAQTAGRIPQVLKSMGGGAATGTTMGGVQGFLSTDGDVGQRLEGAKKGAIAGGLVGGAVPLVASGVGKVLGNMAQNKAVTQAIANSPGADELSATASKMFKSAKSSGVGVTAQRFGTFAHDLATKAHAADIDKDLDSGAWKVYERMVELAQDGFKNPSALTLSRLHNLRQKAQDVAMEFGAKNRTKGFANDMIDGLDNMINTLKPGDMTGPSNLIGSGKNAGNTLLDAISVWSRAKKVGLLETAMDKAGNYASGLESGLRLQFKSILNGKSAKLFTAEEREAMQKVVSGTLPVKALRTLGIFRGIGGAVLGGSLGGGVGAAAGAVAGMGGRFITEKATAAAANRAAKIVSTPYIPKVGAPNVRLPGTLPLLLTNYQGG